MGNNNRSTPNQPASTREVTKECWMTECRIAEVFVDLRHPGTCRVRLEAVSPYAIEVNGKKCIVFFDMAMTDPKKIPAFAPIELKGGWLPARVYETNQLEFEVTKNGNRMKSTQLLSIKTSRQKIRAWVDFESTDNGGNQPNKPQLICFTAI